MKIEAPLLSLIASGGAGLAWRVALGAVIAQTLVSPACPRGATRWRHGAAPAIPPPV
jgi:hypothetical protein